MTDHDPKQDALCAGLQAFVETTARELSAQKASVNAVAIEALRNHLRNALDSGRAFESALDRGMPVTHDLLLAIETLFQATIGSYPELQRLELEAIARALDPESNQESDSEPEVDQISSLRARSLTAAITLQKGLEAGYRSYFEGKAES